MRNVVLALFATSLCMLSSLLQATGLPPEHEAARLMLAVKDLVAEGNWDRANQQLSQLRTLNVEPENDFYYLDGVVRDQLGNSAEAIGSLEQYVIKAGSDGQYYTDALALITRIQERAQVADTQTEASSPMQPELTGSDDGYINSLKALYLTTDPVSALVQQINSLLSSHAYTGSRVKSNELRDGVQYSVAVTEEELLLQVRSYENGQPFLQVEKLNVLGVDPFVDYGCSARVFECFLYHPSKENEKWIKIDRDELVAGELSQAFSKLIRLLQK